MNFKYKITIFTPTYNRGYILGKLYNSICDQTFRDFEWLIVDDGSTDNTEAIVNEWIRSAAFPIRYYKQNNGGKCRAINYGLDLAEGELFFVMDSDDYLTEDALEKVAYWEGTIHDQEGFCGVVGNRGSSKTSTVNTIFDEEYLDVCAFDRYPEYGGKYHIDGDRAEVWYTEIHRKYKYPQFEGENYMPPAVTWDRMAHDGYKLRLFNDIIWICEYLPDGLSAYGNKRVLNNPRSHGLICRQKATFFNYSLMKRLKMDYSFYCDFSDRLTIREIAECIMAPSVVIWIVAIVHKLWRRVKKVLVKE